MTKIKMPEKIPVPDGAYILVEMERASLEEDIVETLMYKIPRLWQIEFEDADESDLPRELFDLVARLEHTLSLDFEDEYEEDEDDDA